MKQTLFQAARTISILDVYNKYTNRAEKAHGQTFMVLCPFHDDHNPSLSLNTKTNKFYCFGCHEHGDGTDFVQKLLHLPAPADAARKICEDFGVEYEEIAPVVKKVVDPMENAETQYAQTPEMMYEVNAALAKCFQRWLPKAPNPHFFDDRGVGSLTEEFRFGYCPKDVVFKKNPELGLKSGLGRHDGTCIFAGYYVVPILDFQGRVIGFVGRLPDEEVTLAHSRYMNSPNSVIYKGSNVFFNAQALKEDDEEIFVVEGVFDALSYIAAGVRNVVATLGGCGLGIPRCNILRDQNYHKIVLAFDRDKGGLLATRLSIIYATDLETAILTADYKGHKDANEVLLAEGPEFLAKATENLPTPEYLIQVAKTYTPENSSENDQEGEWRIETKKDKNALWKYMAAAIGANEPMFVNLYPANKAYTDRPYDLVEYWRRFNAVFEEKPVE